MNSKLETERNRRTGRQIYDTTRYRIYARVCNGTINFTVASGKREASLGRRPRGFASVEMQARAIRPSWEPNPVIPRVPGHGTPSPGARSQAMLWIVETRMADQLRRDRNQSLHFLSTTHTSTQHSPSSTFSRSQSSQESASLRCWL